MTTPPPHPSSGNFPSASSPGASSGPARELDETTRKILGIFEWMLAAFLILAIVITPVVGLLGGVPDSSGSEVATTGAAAIIVSLLIYQVILAAYPWVFEFRRGRTLRERLRFDVSLPKDIGVGVLLFVICFIGAQVITIGVAQLVGLEDSDAASNTGILEDNRGSWVLFAVIFFVVIGAPLAEELLFRGFIMRYLQRFFGVAVAVVASSIIFAIPHWQSDATWQESMVLLSALAFVGLVLAIGAIQTNRLGPAIIGHALFNLAGTIITLYWS